MTLPLAYALGPRWVQGGGGGVSYQRGIPVANSLFCHSFAYREAPGLQGRNPLGPPKEARHGRAVVSYGVAVSYECGTPVFYHGVAYREVSQLQGYFAHNKLRPPSRIAPGPQAQSYCRVLRGGCFL